MSYQVIARKYRPQRFEDVIGQEHVTQTLTNAIRSGRIAHAYLFCGPRGTGKTTVARIFAKALNCTGGPKADFDDTDPRCREIAEGRSLDVLEIDGASNNGVEQVRELRETARFAPAASKFKIYIIDEVHMLSTAAFNALLKTLEEPPAHVKFLFATTDPEKVLPTILSRCQRFDLRRIPTPLIVRHLADIARSEGVSISEGALHAIARGADGGMRDAESTLDQLISFCGPTVQESDVLSMFGLTARDQILGLARAVLEADAARALRDLHELAHHGKDLGRLLGDLLNHFRNLLVYQVSRGDTGLLEVSEAEAEELQRQSALAPVEANTRVLEVLTAAEGRFRDATARKIFLEVTLLKAIQARGAVSLDAVLLQLRQLRGEAGATTPAPTPSPGAAAREAIAPAPANPISDGETAAARPAAVSPDRSAEPVQPAPAVPAAEAESGPAPGPRPRSAGSSVGAGADGSAGSDPQAAWEQVVAKASPMTRAALQAGQVRGLEKGILTVGYPASLEKQRGLVDNERTRKALEARLAEAGCPATVRFVRWESDPPSGSSPADPGTSGRVATTPIPTPPPIATPGTGAGAAGATDAGSKAPARSGSGQGPVGAAPGGGSRARPEKEKVVPVKVDLAEFRSDPLIREALEMFRGHLVEVRQSEESGPR